jgi:malate dehydrogenase (oxaloacetate-decarboxylating)
LPKSNDPKPLYVPYAGPLILETPLLNKGSAFTLDERKNFNITGLIPHNIETIDEQKTRAYAELKRFERDIDKHIYLRNIQDTNETLFYRLVVDHIEEILPLIYAPTVAEACQQFSQIYRRPRGLFVSYPDLENLDDVLQNTTKDNVKVIVVTDGERILGLGDLGIGGMAIPIGKLSLYVACGGISPAYTLPVVLDVGCNNEALIADPLYMGWRHPRITGDEYEEFIEEFIAAANRRWPNVLMQFEDLADDNAQPILSRFKNDFLCFDDDLQGCAATVVAAVLARCQLLGERLSDQTIAIVGINARASNIKALITAQLCLDGMTPEAADQKVSMYPTGAQLSAELAARQYSVLIGVDNRGGVFSEQLVAQAVSLCRWPLILSLANFGAGVDYTGRELVVWSKGQAIVASMVEQDTIEYDGRQLVVSQCSSVHIFPALALGAIASKADQITTNMLLAAARELAATSPLAKDGMGSLFPPTSQIRNHVQRIAKVVYQQAIDDGVALATSSQEIDRRVAKQFWQPNYRLYRRRVSY